MKFGIRTPSLKKSISARTTGAAKRAVKRAVIPGYGKKGTGWVHNPQKAAYNAVYNKTTVSAASLVNGGSSGNANKGGTTGSQGEGSSSKKHGCATAIVVVIIIAILGSCVSQCSNGSPSTSSSQVSSAVVSSEQASSGSFSSDSLSETSSEPSSVQSSSSAPVSSEPESSKAVSAVAPAAAVPKSTTPAAGKKAAGTANNFNTYNNTDQQNAKGYVLNTKTKKFHLPSCNDVPKISKDNYGTAATRNEAIAKGYKPCGHCKP